MNKQRGPVTDTITKAKAWWKSKTIIGTIIALIPMLVKLVNPELTVDIDGALEAGWEGVDLLANAADELWVKITHLFGAVLAIYGRIKAKVGIKPLVETE